MMRRIKPVCVFSHVTRVQVNPSLIVWLFLSERPCASWEQFPLQELQILILDILPWERQSREEKPTWDRKPATCLAPEGPEDSDEPPSWELCAGS